MCNGDCDQGRSCDCSTMPEREAGPRMLVCLMAYTMACVAVTAAVAYLLWGG